MKKWIYTIAIASLIGGVAAPAYADKHGKGEDKRAAYAEKYVERMIKRLDTDGDGVISRDEYLAAAGQRFDTMDANNDGVVTADELRAHNEQRREAMRERWQERKKDGDHNKKRKRYKSE